MSIDETNLTFIIMSAIILSNDYDEWEKYIVLSSTMRYLTL